MEEKGELLMAKGILGTHPAQEMYYMYNLIGLLVCAGLPC